MLVAVVPAMIRVTDRQKVPTGVAQNETIPVDFELKSWCDDGEVTWWVDDPDILQMKLSCPTNVRPLDQIHSAFDATPEEMEFYGWWG